MAPIGFLSLPCDLWSRLARIGGCLKHDSALFWGARNMQGRVCRPVQHAVLPVHVLCKKKGASLQDAFDRGRSLGGR